MQNQLIQALESQKKTFTRLGVRQCALCVENQAIDKCIEIVKAYKEPVKHG